MVQFGFETNVKGEIGHEAKKEKNINIFRICKNQSADRENLFISTVKKFQFNFINPFCKAFGTNCSFMFNQ
jgi:hypothetical protein